MLGGLSFSWHKEPEGAVDRIATFRIKGRPRVVYYTGPGGEIYVDEDGKVFSTGVLGTLRLPSLRQGLLMVSKPR